LPIYGNSLSQPQPIGTGQPIYSNAPDALYILTGLAGRMSPSQDLNNSIERTKQVLTLKGSWSQEDGSYLIWFDNLKGRNYLFTVDELQNPASIREIIRVADGAIYSIQGK